jgi:hypothetical protein
MSAQSFYLKPFLSAGPLAHLKITGKIIRRSGTVAISYALFGPMAEIVIPGLAGMPVRKNALWEETCFEFFLASRDSDQYWEFNLSPAGDWNVYRFTDYRQGMMEENVFVSLPFVVHRGPGALRLTLEVDLPRLVPADRPLEVAIAVVLQAPDGRLTYWALTHPGPHPDFHRRDSFIVTM